MADSKSSAWGQPDYLMTTATKLAVEALSEENKKAVTSLREAAGKAGYENVPDVFLMRFLVNQKFDATAAFEKLTVFLKWYKEEKIGELVMDAEPKENKVMQKCIPHSVTNGCDNEGRPIYFELTGKIQAGLLRANITKEDFLKCHAWGIQQMMARAEESSKKLSKPVTNFVTVLDLEGIHLGQRVGLDYLIATVGFDDKYYPNFLGKVYVLNAGWLFPMFWQFMKPYLPAFVSDHIELVSGDPATELPKYFPKESLPPKYGGSGKEIPFLDTSDLKSSTADTYNGEDLHEENIGAGDKMEICIEAENGAGTFGWYFISEGDYDVGFSVTVEEKDGEVEAKKYEKLITDSGSYTSKGPCKVKIVWDNSYSLFTSKTIKYYASVYEVEEKTSK
mmetsp:Transcript_21782/g.53344  ORF Transcript_21782/g.53344 Transcript_21782/m.53344 type:complete len:392 (-) Transcript_21782:342-1517(-)|eukprot:CAMPEP_0114523326 /NCGR_PEP_ID=MMETSP0109-20121206/21230_1 /TAXON_ID=29199 /ORGANISM="Chlorarachnion reptans, Strain CCCM449" /LENGTH=391 /DNA_ID=CAMNT_0001704631 /DNA_START=116 /DNA_END=1291 /DNA_ORIENTATION=-